MPAEFHFLSPAWFLALLPLAALIVALSRRRQGLDAWRRVVDPRLLEALAVDGDGVGGARRWPLALLGLGWLVAVIALANPTFERLETPAFRDAAARVIALDLSQSMLAEDLAPTRLARARFKVDDILRRSAAGQVGLVVFSGDAFSVIPLTDDAETIRNLLPALEPAIMPAPGSRPDRAISAALDLFRQAGARDGEVVLLTDDAGGARARSAAGKLREAGHRLAVVGVGTREGAPVPGVRTSRGAVITRLNTGELRSLARNGGGAYAEITADEGDLDAVLAEDVSGRVRSGEEPRRVEVWKELGPWIALALVPIAALGARRGWVLVVPMLALNLALNLAPGAVPAAMADDAPSEASPSESSVSGWRQGWRELWQRRDQQAASALARGEFERAATLAEDPSRLGAARYRMGDYATAAESFEALGGASARYNRGNALALDGQLEEALAAYDEALSIEPGMEDALHNRAEVERALRQQQQQQSQDQSGDPDQSEPSDDGQSDGGQSSGDRSNGDESDSEASDSRSDDQSGDPSQDQASDESSTGDGADEDDPRSEQAENSEEGPGASEPSTEEQSAETGTGGGAGADRDDREQAAAQSSAEQQADADEAGASGANDEQPEGESAEQAQARREREQRAAEDYRREAQAQGGGERGREPEPSAAGAADDALDPAELEARRAADQWLRRIPDDPGGLLRRKFMYQYQRRAGAGGTLAEDPW